VGEVTPGQRNCTAHLLTAARLYLNSPPELAKNWGQVDLNLNDYHSDPMEISSTFSIPDITDWWEQQEERHSKCADGCNVVGERSSIIPDGFGADSGCSLWQDDIDWRQSNNEGKSLCENVIGRQCARAHIGILGGDDSALDPTIREPDPEI